MAGTRTLRDGLEGTERNYQMFEPLTKTPRTELAFVSGDTVKSFTITATAKATLAVLEMPSFSGAVVTGTLSIENSDSVEIYSKGDMAENETHVIVTSVPLVGINTVKVTLSTDPLSSGTCYVTLYLEGGD